MSFNKFQIDYTTKLLLVGVIEQFFDNYESFMNNFIRDKQIVRQDSEMKVEITQYGFRDGEYYVYFTCSCETSIFENNKVVEAPKLAYFETINQEMINAYMYIRVTQSDV